MGEEMDLEQAITTAMDYEGKVYKTYLEAMDEATDEVGKRVFKTLCDEEKEHIDYLRERLDEWQKTGAINVADLGTAIPSHEEIQAGVEKLREKVTGESPAKHGSEIELLRRALKVETETSNFYQEMVRTLDACRDRGGAQGHRSGRDGLYQRDGFLVRHQGVRPQRRIARTTRIPRPTVHQEPGREAPRRVFQRKGAKAQRRKGVWFLRLGHLAGSILSERTSASICVICRCMLARFVFS